MNSITIHGLAVGAGLLASLQLAAAQASRVEIQGRAVAEGKAGESSGTPDTSADPAPPGVPAASGTSVSSSTAARTSADGTAVTTITTERDGKKTTRTIVVGRDGNVVVSDPSQSAGSAVPAEQAEPSPSLSSGGWLGVHSVPVSDVLRSQLEIPEDRGIVLEFVADDGPAAAGGLRANDIVLAINAEPVSGVQAFRARLARTKPGEQVTLDFLRKGKPSTATVTLGERPADAGPGPKVAVEAIRLSRESQDKNPLVRRGVVVDGAGNTHVIENGDPFDLLLNDPNVPEELKKHLRESRELMQRSLPKGDRAESPDDTADETPEASEPGKR